MATKKPAPKKRTTPRDTARARSVPRAEPEAPPARRAPRPAAELSAPAPLELEQPANEVPALEEEAEEVSEIFSDETGGLPVRLIQKILCFRPTEVEGSSHMAHVGTVVGGNLSLTRAAQLYGGGLHQFRAFVGGQIKAYATHVLPGPPKALNGSAMAPLLETAEGVLSVSRDPGTAAAGALFQRWIAVMREDFKAALDTQHATNVLLSEIVREAHSNSKTDKLIELLFQRVQEISAENSELRKSEADAQKKRIELAIKEAEAEAGDGNPQAMLEKVLEKAPEILKSAPWLQPIFSKLGGFLFGGAGAPSAGLPAGQGVAPPLNPPGQ